MSAIVLLCGNLFDGISETLSGPMEILVQGNRIASVGGPLSDLRARRSSIFRTAR